MKRSILSTLILLSGFVFQAQAQIITTIAGGGNADPGDGGSALDCALAPIDFAFDQSKNLLITDRNRNRIRKIDAVTGVITTIAGTGTAGYTGDGGPATAAQLRGPYGLYVDASNNIYVSEEFNHCIRKIDASGIITTIAGTGTSGYSGDGGLATAAQLYSPAGLIMDALGNLYIADFNNHRVRKISPSGIISTFAGTGLTGYAGEGGPATAADLQNPQDVAITLSGDIIIADYEHNKIRKVNASGIISTIAGSGGLLFNGDNMPATNANITPLNLAVDSYDNIYFSDVTNFRIRKIAPSGIITTVAGDGTWGFSGDGGPATAAKIIHPSGILLDANGDLYLGDYGNQRIRLVRNIAGLSSSETGFPLEVYPNPSRGDINIKTNNAEEATIVLQDVLGKDVRKTTAGPNDLIHFDNIPGGIYTLLIYNEHLRRVEKVIVVE